MWWQRGDKRQGWDVKKNGKKKTSGAKVKKVTLLFIQSSVTSWASKMQKKKKKKLQAVALSWVSSNKVNNWFTLMHTLVLLEAKLPSCCSW